MSEAIVTHTGFSYRRVCRGLALPFSTFQRWRRRRHRGLPLLQSPGPKKTAPLPLAQLQPELAALPHRLQRTRGTAELYRRHQSRLSRRKLNALVHAERTRQKRQRRLAWQRLTWLSPNTAWAIDATEHVADQSGRKLYLVAIQDLASGLRFAPLVSAQLHGPTIASHLRQLFAQQGAPLFLKRDNGSVFNDHAMESLLAHACVLPLNSPNACPRYNGAIEKGIRDMKASLLPCLPAPRHWQPDHVAPYIRAVLHLENSKPRRRLAGQSAVSTFFQRPRLRPSRRQRHLTFAWIKARADATVSQTMSPNQQSCQRAWRGAALTWLRRQGLVKLTKAKTKQTKTNPELLPLF